MGVNYWKISKSFSQAYSSTPGAYLEVHTYYIYLHMLHMIWTNKASNNYLGQCPLQYHDLDTQLRLCAKVHVKLRIALHK